VDKVSKLVRVFQRNKTNRVMGVGCGRERGIPFKNWIIVEAGKSKICREGLQANDLVKIQCCSSSPKSACQHNSFFVSGGKSLSLKACSFVLFFFFLVKGYELYLFIFISFIHMCIQCLGHFSPPYPSPSPPYSSTPSLSSHISSLPGRNYFVKAFS
jgi:hypothetical protein